MKKLFAMAATMMLAVTLVACGSTTTEEPQTTETRVVEDVKGSVEIPVDPQRIVDLSGASDTLSLLGFDVVGTANSDGYDYTKLPTYLSFLASGGSIFVFDGAGLGSVLYQDLGLAKPVGMPEQVDVSLPVVSYEGLAAIEADEILAIGTDEDMVELLGNPIWQNMPAVKAGNVVELPASPYFNIGYSPIGRLDFINEIESLLAGNNE